MLLKFTSLHSPFIICCLSLFTFYANATQQGSETANQARKPHIVIILADDLGFDDVSFRGSNEFLTPNIDALGYHGRILDRFYAQPLCTPSRAALLTGLYPMHIGTQLFTHLNGDSESLPSNFTLMSNIFQNAGYSTNLIGKWNLGHARKEDTPTYRGFDNHYGFWGGHIDHFTHRSANAFCNQTLGFDFRRNMVLDCSHSGIYDTELFAEEAERIIENMSDKSMEQPLFLMISHAAPHDPLQAPEEELRKFSYIKNPARRTYAAMISILDRSVGRVVHALERANMLQNSIIIFLSDNGAQAATSSSGNAAGSNWPLRGQKYSLWEGGIRLAAAIWSPLLGSASQSICRSPIYIADWLPTLAAAAGIEIPPKLSNIIDGRNVWSALSTTSTENTTTTEFSVLHVWDPKHPIVAYTHWPWKYLNGTTQHGQFDGVLTYREVEDIDPRAQRYVVEVRNSPTSKALRKFDEQRLTQSRVENLRNGARVHCGDLKRSCNPLIEECLFNIEMDACEQNNLVYEAGSVKILNSLRSEIDELRRSEVETWLNFNCNSKDLSDPALHNCAWTNFLDEPASGVRMQCSNAGPPCDRGTVL